MGSVITTRQALAAISYAVTGGLTCQDVHRKYTRGQGNVWQYPHLYHQAIFADLLSASNRGQVPAFSSLRQLDPGSVSLREFDDQLEPDDVPITFLPPKLNDDQSVRSRREALRQSDLMKSHIGFLRRFEFFESGTDHARRMGLLSGTEFVEIATGSAPRVEVRDTLLRGLEAVQGVRRPGESPDFLVLDPAFFSHRNRAAVISARVQGINVNVKSHVQHWAESCTEQPIMPIAVEWSSRTVYLKISGSSGNVTIPLNLMLFELLRRWAGGLTTRGQYEGEIRSLTRLLATLAPPESGTDEIEVLVNGERRSLTIDVGDRIRSGGL
ncbi:hypothetical protein [Williamsia muralis]|nr:hypothetical protein [Williamsia marianensis]